ncbi:MAG: zinc metalloprotease HtpX [Desulfobacteraceae bacterium]
MNTQRLRHLKWLGALKSFLLIVGLSVNLAGLGWLLGGPLMSLCVALSLLIAYIISPSVSPALILRFYRGRLILWHHAPRIYAIVNELARRAGLENPPQLYYIPSPVPNALAIGTRKQSGIALSDGLLKQLDMVEVSAVLAHEISHIINKDIGRNTLAAISVRLTHSLGMIGMLLLLLNLPLMIIETWQVSWVLVGGLILSPIFGNALVAALSHVHEYQADLQAIQLTKDPHSLTSALLKLETSDQFVWKKWLRQGVRAGKDWGLFSTHPATAKRIKRLEKIGVFPRPFSKDPFPPPNSDTFQLPLNSKRRLSWLSTLNECCSYWRRSDRY